MMRKDRTRPRVAWLLRLYPRRWRDRYEDEVLATLEQHRPTLATWLTFVLSALDAHLDPHFRGMERRQSMPRARAMLLVVFAAYTGLFAATLIYPKTAGPAQATAAPRVISPSGVVAGLGLGVALLAVLAGGLPILANVFSQALRARQLRTLLLLTTPLWALAALVGSALLLEDVLVAGRTTPPDLFPDSLRDFGGNAGLLSWTAVVLLAAAVSTLAVARAVSATAIGRGQLRVALVAATLTTLAMGVVSATFVLWGTLVAQDAPDWFGAPGGFLLDGGAWWLGVAAFMVAATLVAAVGVIRGVAYARTALPQRYGAEEAEG